ncbi:MAG TPA: hypothetical protein VNC59_07775, partial [Thermoanaerobaculia bacterium]|nr:hypothetical protein [Thermoanaerobaculia bacterium]
LAAFAGRDAAQPGLERVVERIVDRTHDGGAAPERGAALRRVAERVVLEQLIALAAHERATPEARAGAEWGLRRIAALLKVRAPGVPAEAAHRAAGMTDVTRYLERREAPPRREPLRVPRRISLGDEPELCWRP